MSDCGKGIVIDVRYVFGKMNESEPSDDASLALSTVKTGVVSQFWDKSGRNLFTDPVAVGV